MKKTELILFGLLILTLILSLQNFTWTLPLLFAEFIGLICIWSYGFFSRKISEIQRFNKTEIIERLFCIPLFLGLIFNVSEIPNSSSIISIGLLVLSGLMAFKGIKKLIKKDIFTGIELLFIALLFLGNFFRLKHLPGGTPLKINITGLLSLLYLAMSLNFIIVSIREKKQTLGIAGLILYLSLSLFVFAILFDTMFWPGEIGIFFSALITSFIALPILIIQTIKQKALPDDYRNQIKNLYKRFIILFSISLFLTVSTPKQNLRIEFGNRPDLINADFDCRFNYKLDSISKDKACQEYKMLSQIWMFGLYPEGITKEEIEIIKENFDSYY